MTKQLKQLKMSGDLQEINSPQPLLEEIEPILSKNQSINRKSCCEK